MLSRLTPERYSNYKTVLARLANQTRETIEEGRQAVSSMAPPEERREEPEPRRHAGYLFLHQGRRLQCRQADDYRRTRAYH